MNKKILAVLALACLAACLAAPCLHFLGKLGSEGNQRIFLVASVGWFVLAPLSSRPR
jgi:hypothetical protein